MEWSDKPGPKLKDTRAFDPDGYKLEAPPQDRQPRASQNA